MRDISKLSDGALEDAIQKTWDEREVAHRRYKDLCAERERRAAVERARKAIASIPPEHRAAVIAAASVDPTSAVGTPGA